MADVDLIVKLGGSGITNKKVLEQADHAKIDHVAELIQQCVEAHLKVIVVHGAGSFGHHQAKEYKVKHGWKTAADAASKASVKEGFCKTRLSVCKLNQIVTESFIERGICAVSQSPCGKWVTRNGKVIKHDGENLIKLLTEGFVPILHGDCVTDTEIGCTILSGDTIISQLCTVLCAKRVVFLTNVAGIYDKPPSEPDAVLLKEINLKQSEDASSKIEMSCSREDVTGGMQLKLLSAGDIVKHSQGSMPVFVCDTMSQGAKNACLYGNLKGQDGTKIFLKSP